MKILTLLLSLVIIIFGISFAALNADPVAINYYLGATQLPLSLLLALVFGIGGCFGLLVMAGVWFKSKHNIRQLHHRLKLAEKEIANLRSIPLKDAP